MKRLEDMNVKELDAEIAELKRLRALMVDRMTRATMRGEDDVNVDDIMAKVKMHEREVFGDDGESE